ncbi:nucleotidyltransferase family protein [Gramella sp. MAR_2010_147]|uniref:nucleotidyltransferase family protein n=1 Tax=Gramella sp. MAR_2010_147 TaxID=1250205 RepID=UPI00087CE837|nr:nucleotidyltransferase family protein [Gramella sp. MAR_2010_147]SDR71145.1 molybdenum cofactor cytidylyltransferase [Gramella sp. MAR_2010_147]
MIQHAKIGVVILAAGSSSRLGYAKQLVEFNGKSLLQNAIDTSCSIGFKTNILLLGARAEEIISSIDPKDFEIVINKQWREGMSGSIKEALNRSLELYQDLQHLLILVSDQPFICKESLEKLIEVQLKSKSPATFSEYVGNVGVPAIFSAEVFPYLNELKGDQGAKKLIMDHKIDFKTVKFEKGNFDVDTQEDVELLKKMKNE